MEKLNTYTDKIMALLIDYGPKLVMAIIVLILGLWIIKGVVNTFGKMLSKKGIDESLQPFLKGLVSILLKIMLLISVASMLGIATTSFVAVLGAGGLAVGLALQGSLANFAGGVLILIFKPYKIGDLIDAQGHFGRVQSIQIFNTIMLTPDNKTVIIPNGAISNGDITNVSASGKIRVELVIGIGYGEDIKKAKEVIKEVMKSDPNVMSDPAPECTVIELGGSSVDLAVRPWTDPETYWDVYFSVTENVKLALDANNISIPFPQRDVHMHQVN